MPTLYIRVQHTWFCEEMCINEVNRKTYRKYALIRKELVKPNAYLVAPSAKDIHIFI